MSASESTACFIFDSSGLLTSHKQMPLGMPDRPQAFFEAPSDSDFHQLLIPTQVADASRKREAADNSSGHSSDAGSFFVPEPLSRSNSVYSFSRASLSSQLASLSSMSLPQAESLAANIRALPTARKAVKALNNSAEQIMSWTKKALNVLKNLDAEDDVEWAAEAGREALNDTTKTINQFENLISVYVQAIEELQTRKDISDVRHQVLAVVVEQMETTLDSWDSVRQNLKRIHNQVELAMEWEELWNTVLADVGQELDRLSSLVFEMEEKRHMSYIQPSAPVEPTHNIDLNEIESFMEDPMSKKKKEPVNARFSMTFEESPLNSPVVNDAQDDSDLLALFARMQPLRASLDFLPMRTSMFQQRAEEYFPNACKELEVKKQRLESSWAQLSDEAETLRRELSEDRWIMVFRNAGRQAQKMLDSVERSIKKVTEAIDEGYQRTNPAGLGKRIESFEAKRMHYMPAVQRVLSIIQKGLKDRLTVNGEILRLNRDLGSKSRELEDTMITLSRQLEPVTPRHNARLRESISSIVSADRSFSSGTIAGTPGSSPASSIDLTPNQAAPAPSKYGLNGYSRPRPSSTTRGPPISSNNRRTSLQPLRPTTPSGTTYRGRGISPAPPSVYRQGHYKPPVVSVPPRPSSVMPSEKPRWSAVISPAQSEKSSKVPVNLTPSSQRKFPPRAASSLATHAQRSPLSRETISTPQPPQNLSTSRRSSSQFKSFAERVASPSPARSNLMGPVPYHRSRNVTTPVPSTIRSPSSLAVHSYSKPTISNGTPPPASLSGLSASAPRGHTRPASRSSIPIRSALDSSPNTHITPKYPSRSPRSSLDSARGHDVLDEPVSENDENENDHDVDTEHSSSPLAKRIPRPPSSLASSRGGKRASLIPVPVSGRVSSMGHRND